MARGPHAGRLASPPGPRAAAERGAGGGRRHAGGPIAGLDASVDTLHRRTSGNRDRPLLREGDPKAKLQSLMDARRPLYKGLADLRIVTDDLSQDEAAYGLAESVRMRFSGL